MAKSLTREDLIYILNEALKYSQAENNALELKPDGMYVESHHVHSDQTSLHLPDGKREIIALLTIDENGRLMYDGKPSTIILSDEADNALELNVEDGSLYVKRIPTAVASHMENSSVHVTVLEKETWNGMLNAAKQYTDTTLDALRRVQHVELVNEMPPVQEADPLTIYLCADENTAEEVTMRMKFDDHYVTFNITKTTLNKYYTKTEANNLFLSKTEAANTYLPNTNATNLQKIQDDGGHPVFENKRFLSQRANNGLTCDQDGGLYFPDIEAEVRSLVVCAAYSKTNLCDMELKQQGRYYLKDNINNYGLILIEYYYMPSKEVVIDDVPLTKGYAKTAIVDPDTMEFLYDRGIDYCLEVGYGMADMNTKIYIHNDQIWVNYYHDVCIYKITGISKTQEENNPFEEEPIENGQEGGDD